ncbi:TolC family protein [Echinicola marina]|uniref:TolC family protein n=1 Tax=Echinicola marina TaxID=2859768 RepID=UPI001CF6A3BA|nr:TolC family protein [Echinicola marina]UCS93299.1 TolC family protein [Echinicola marina]
MLKTIVFVLCGFLLSLGVYAQSTSIESILNQIEQNNQELIALGQYVESKRLDLKSGNNLPDPQFGAYYLPFGEHNSGDYTEFQITQSFEFPTVYGSRSNLIDQESRKLELEYQIKKQDVLALAKNYCLKLIYLDKRLNTETVRVEQAQKVFNQVQALFEKEQVGILEMNKAKVAWMKEQFKIQQIESEKKNIKLLLSNLNGGKEVSLLSNEYELPLDLQDRESIWQEKQLLDPIILDLKQQETIAEQNLRLAKNKALPNLTAGYNRQGVSNSHYSGGFIGVSIPLWNNHNKVKAAKSTVNFKKAFSSSRLSNAYAAYEKQFNDYQIMLSKFREYQNTLSDLDTEELLFQAYELGELSFLEYYMELQFYREAYDAMLEIEYQLYISHTQLLKHQL